MSDSNLQYISLSDAAKYSEVYSQGYLSLRARQGKFKATKLGRNWVTTKQWVDEYIHAEKNVKANGIVHEEKQNLILEKQVSSIEEQKQKNNFVFPKYIFKFALASSIATILVFTFFNFAYLKNLKNDFIKQNDLAVESILNGYAKVVNYKKPRAGEYKLFTQEVKKIKEEVFNSDIFFALKELKKETGARFLSLAKTEIKIPEIKIPTFELPAIKLPAISNPLVLADSYLSGINIFAKEYSAKAKQEMALVADGYKLVFAEIKILEAITKSQEITNNKVDLALVDLRSSFIEKNDLTAVGLVSGGKKFGLAIANLKNSFIQQNDLVAVGIISSVGKAKYSFVNNYKRASKEFFNIAGFSKEKSDALAFDIDIKNIQNLVSSYSYGMPLVLKDYLVLAGQKFVSGISSIKDYQLFLRETARELGKEFSANTLALISEFDQQNDAIADNLKNKTKSLFANIKALTIYIGESVQNGVDIVLRPWLEKQQGYLVKETSKTNGGQTSAKPTEGRPPLVQKITQIQPVKEITKETNTQTIISKVDSQELAELKANIANLQNLVGKVQYYSPSNNAPTSPVYIGSSGLEISGNAVLASLGVSGFAGIRDLGVGNSFSVGSGGSALTVDKEGRLTASSITSPSITGGSFTSTGNITATGDLSVGGSTNISGNLNVGGIAVFSTSTIAMTTTTASVFSIGTSTTANLFTVAGSGNIVFQNTGQVYIVPTGTTTIGASTSTPTIITGYVASDILPYYDNVYNLGSSAYRWKQGYFGDTLAVNGTSTLATTTATNFQALKVNILDSFLVVGTSTLATSTATQLVISGNGLVNGYLTVGTSTQYYPLYVSGDSYFSGNSTTTGNSQIAGNLQLVGSQTIGSTLNISATSTQATTSITQLLVSGNSILSGGLWVSGTSTLATTSVTFLSVSGNATTSGNYVIGGNLNIGGSLYGSAANLTNIPATTTFNSATISGVLGVTGTSTLATTTATSMTADFYIGNGSLLTGMATTTFASSTITGSGTTTVNYVIGGNLNIGGSLYASATNLTNIPATTTFNSATISGTLGVTGTSTLATTSISLLTVSLNGTVAGNFGIGTTTPSSKLSISGTAGSKLLDIGFSTGTSTLSIDGSGLLTFTLGDHSSSSMVIQEGTNSYLTFDTSNDAEKIVVGKNLEIGPMSVDQDSGAVLLATMDVTASSSAGTANSLSIGIDGNSILTVYSSSTGNGQIEQMRVGIGTTTPIAMLEMRGNASTTGPMLRISTSTIEALFIDGMGLVGISTSSSAFNLAVAGTQYTTGATYLGSTLTVQATSTLATTSLTLLVVSGNGTVAGNFGIGTTTPSSKLSISGTAGSKLLDIGFSTGTSTLSIDGSGLLTISLGDHSSTSMEIKEGTNAYLTFDTSNDAEKIVVGKDLEVGPLQIDENSGAVRIADMSVTSTAGTVESLSIALDGISILTVYAEATSSSLIGQMRIGIGTTTPISMLEMRGNASTTGPMLRISTSTVEALFIDGMGLVGIGTTSPIAMLSVRGGTNATAPLFRVSTSSVEALFIDSTGNVGIGTSTQTFTLTTAGTQYTTGATYLGSTLNITATSTQATTSITQLLVSGNSILSGGLWTTGTSTLATTTVTYFSASVGGYSLGKFGIGTTTPISMLSIKGDGSATTPLLRVTTSTIESLFIDSAGKIGIGTTSPVYSLDILARSGIGTFRIASSSVYNTLLIDNNGLLTLGLADHSSSSLVIQEGTAGTAYLTFDTSNDAEKIVVGKDLEIGTMNVDQDSGAVRFANMNITASSIAGTANSLSIGLDQQDILTVYSSSTGDGMIEQMRVGIGTTTPLAVLEIRGNASTTGDLFRVSTSTIYGMVIDGMGNIGIGTTSPNTFMLEVAGNVGPSANSVYNLGSNSRRWATFYASTTWAQYINTGDLTFANQFRFTEAPASSSQQVLYLSNQLGDKLLTIKEDGSLEIGSPEKPAGITLYDEDTGEPYCLKMKAGAMISVAGKCGDSSAEPTLNEVNVPQNDTPAPVIPSGEPSEASPEQSEGPPSEESQPPATSTETEIISEPPAETPVIEEPVPPVVEEPTPVVEEAPVPESTPEPEPTPEPVPAE